MVVLSSVSDVLAVAFAEVARDTLVDALGELRSSPRPEEPGALDEVRLRLVLLDEIGDKLAAIADAEVRR
jgi:hypothetical protein